MSEALAEIDAAIAEVTKARQAVTGKKSKQVFSIDEVDRLRAVAYAWFKTHRSNVMAQSVGLDFKSVDGAYQTILTATGRHSARSTYAQALREAKQSLVAIRSLVVTNSNGSVASGGAATAVATPEVPPNFTPLASNPTMQMILMRRWNEVQQCIGSQAYLAATVMMGGLLESLLLARINVSRNQPAVFTAITAPRDRVGRTLPLADWKLVKMVDVAHELTWISKSAKDVGNVLRDFRNYIHPHKEYTDGVTITEDDARMFWEVTKAISRQVLGSVGKSP